MRCGCMAGNLSILTTIHRPGPDTTFFSPSLALSYRPARLIPAELSANETKINSVLKTKQRFLTLVYCLVTFVVSQPQSHPDPSTDPSA